MPGGDRTGPMGMGPMTGRAAGYCAGYSVPGYMNPYSGRGFGRGGGWGRGFGRGRGWGQVPGYYGYSNPWYPTAPYGVPPTAAPSHEDEMKFLKEQTEALQAELKAINERMEELGKETEEKK